MEAIQALFRLGSDTALDTLVLTSAWDEDEQVRTSLAGALLGAEGPTAALAAGRRLGLEAALHACQPF